MVGATVSHNPLTNPPKSPIIYENIYEENTMQQISISQIQRNLHTLDNFDIIEVIDKKRNKVKGYFIDSKYVSYVEEIASKLQQAKKSSQSAAGILSHYAPAKNAELEQGAWQRAAIEKYKKQHL